MRIGQVQNYTISPSIMASPHSNDPFINADAISIGSQSYNNYEYEESSTPFQAMQEDPEEQTQKQIPVHNQEEVHDQYQEHDQEPEQDQGIAMVAIGSTSSNTSHVSKYEEFNEENDLKVYQGHADFDAEFNAAQIQGSKWYFGKTKRATVKFLYLTVFTVVGALLRIVLAQLFGEECLNPGTVGWLKAGQPLCVTAEGEATLAGGIIFSDLPANLLGCFIMGMMESTITMNLPKPFPIAWLNENNFFQTYEIIHIAITVGLCGSLTTFSSWNSEMVVMMMGVDADRGSLIFRGLFGYLIGVETALASFVFGKNIAKYLHAVVNAPVQKEAEESLKKRECGVYLNSQLSDYERRFLSELDMGEFSIYVHPAAEQELHLWRNSTREHRRVGNPMLALLTDIEYSTLVLDENIDQQLLVPAIMAKWDLDALNKWRVLKRDLPQTRLNFVEPLEFRFAPAFRVAFFGLALVVIGVIMIKNDDDYSVTYRSMLYSALFAPAGTFLRIKLSSNWNGRWNRYSWFPLGTFAANLLACIISASMIGVEYRMNGTQDFWTSGTIRAAKIGFAGSLSTVSTFIKELSDFLSSQSPIRGYMYAIVSVVLCGSASALCYYLITFNTVAGVYYRNGQGYGY